MWWALSNQLKTVVEERPHSLGGERGRPLADGLKPQLLPASPACRPAPSRWFRSSGESRTRGFGTRPTRGPCRGRSRRSSPEACSFLAEPLLRVGAGRTALEKQREGGKEGDRAPLIPHLTSPPTLNNQVSGPSLGQGHVPTTAERDEGLVAALPCGS